MKHQPLSRWLGNAIGIALAVYICILLGGTVIKNYDLSQQISSMEQQIKQLQSQRMQLNFDLQYYLTDSYRQREAKANLGLVMPGESEIVLPSQSPQPQATHQVSAKPQSNVEQWLNFLEGKT